MPSKFVRIKLLTNSVTKELLYDITDEEIEKEGVFEGYFKSTPRQEFKKIWDKMYKNTKFAWANNPYVWRIKFVKV
jgi:hypothetical protein